MSNLYRRPSIDASYQVSINLAKGFQGRRFFLIGKSETRLPVAAMLVNDRDEMSDLYRRPSIDDSIIHGRSSIKIAHFVPIR
jgi:hypothetical protein